LPPFHLVDLRCPTISNFVKLDPASKYLFVAVNCCLCGGDPLMIGKTLSHYQITNLIGKGGMGEVYQAKDQRLGRDVAIKVLPEEFAKDTDRVARFQREAKLLASLNHPNIAAIYGLEESGGTNFLVLELVEGGTLADRIKQGPITVEEALKLALQIAEGLEAAHEKGVIHRDLKPANIKVTPDGKVKVLDFGLAKAFAGEQENLNLSNSPTLSNAATQQGLILGTAAYMSPEQARGKEVDRRADIWAFGCVLYEMLTGRAAFSGRDVTEILAAVIRAEPEWKSLPANLHWRLRELLERCLEKEAKDRYSGINDARVDIQKALSDPSGVLVQSRMAVRHRKVLSLKLPWVAAIAILCIIFAGVAVWKLKPPEPRQVVRLYYELPKDQEFSGIGGRSLAVSPDGRYLVYGAKGGLYLRRLDELEAQLIPGTEGNPEQPFFSPDGKWIGYWSTTDKKLKKVAIGILPMALCDAESFKGGSWSGDNKIMYGDPARGVMRVSASGGTPELLAKADPDPLSYPQILPDGKSVILASGEIQEKVVVLSLKSGKLKELFQGDAPRYLPTGHIAFLDDRARLTVIPFDPSKLEVAGEAVPIIEDVLGPSGETQYAISESGTLVYMPMTETAWAASKRTLVWVDRNGKEEPLAASPNAYADPAISPDGTKIALGILSVSNTDIWIWDLIRKNLTKLILDPGGMGDPLWTPDGKQIVFSKRHAGKNAIYWKSADGTGKEEPFSSPAERPIWAASWADNGKTLVLDETGTSANIGMVSTEGDRKWKPLLEEKYNESMPKISPDGRWLAYVSDESGQREVYVCPFPEVNAGKWQVSVGGGVFPLWSPDRQELFYVNGDKIMAVSVKTDPTFSSESPRILFKGTYAFVFGVSQWDISRDGKRFLMMKGAEPSASTATGPRRINIVVNWFEELRQRVPIK
jgi:serine/threonine protein kinase